MTSKQAEGIVEAKRPDEEGRQDRPEMEERSSKRSGKEARGEREDWRKKGEEGGYGVNSAILAGERGESDGVDKKPYMLVIPTTTTPPSIPI